MRKFSRGSGFVDPKDVERARLLALALVARDPVALARLSAPTVKSKGKVSGASNKVEVGPRGNYLGRSSPAKKTTANSFLLGSGSGGVDEDSAMKAATRLSWSVKAPSFLDNHKSTILDPHEARYLNRITPEEQQSNEVRHDGKKLGNFVRQMRKTTPGLRTWAESKLRSETKAFERQIATGAVPDNADNRRLLAEKYTELQKFNNDPLRGATKRERERFESMAEMAYNPVATMKRMTDTGIDLADFYSEYKQWRSSGAHSDGESMVATTDGRVIPLSDAARKLAAASKISQGDLFRQMDGRMGKHFRKVFTVAANATTKSMENQRGLTEKDIYLKGRSGLDDGVSSFSVGMQNRAIRANPDLAQVGDLEAIWRHAQDGFNNPVTILSQAVDSSINKGRYRTDDELAPGEKILRFFTDQIVQNMATKGVGNASVKSLQALRGLKALQPVMKGLQSGSQALDKLGIAGSIARVGGKQTLGAIPSVLTQARIDSNTTGKDGWQAVKDAAAEQVQSITDLRYLGDSSLSLEDKAIRALQQAQVLGGIAKRHANTPKGLERASGWLKNAHEHPNFATVSNTLQKIASILPKEKRAGFEKASQSLLEKMAEKAQPLGKRRGGLVPNDFGSRSHVRDGSDKPSYFVEHPDAETREVPLHRAQTSGLVHEILSTTNKDQPSFNAQRFLGQNVTGLDDVATLAQGMEGARDGRVEHGYIIFEKNGQIEGVEKATRNLPGITPMSAAGHDHFEAWLTEALRKYGATTVYLMHNHPSGDPSPSPQDHKYTDHFAENLHRVSKGKVKFGGHAVVDHTKYAAIHGKGSHEIKPIENEPLSHTYLYKGLNKSFSPGQQIAQLGRMFAPKGDHAILLEMAPTGEFRSAHGVSSAALRPENHKEFLAYAQALRNGGTQLYLVLPDHDLASIVSDPRTMRAMHASIRNKLFGDVLTFSDADVANPQTARMDRFMGKQGREEDLEKRYKNRFRFQRLSDHPIASGSHQRSH